MLTNKIAVKSFSNPFYAGDPQGLSQDCHILVKCMPLKCRALFFL